MRTAVLALALAAASATTIAHPGGAFAAAPTPVPKAPDDGADTPYLKAVKGAEEQTGLFTIWRKDGKIYLEVRDDQFDSDFLEHVVPANGLGEFDFESGEQFAFAARLVRFHLAGNTVALIWPHTLFMAKPGTPLATAVDESSADSVGAMLPVIAENTAGKSRLLDASALVGDVLNLASRLSDPTGTGGGQGPGAYHLDPSRTYFGPTRAFPENVMIEADQTFVSAAPNAINTVPDPRYVQMRVKYNFSQILSSPDYMPRLYDDRVGYWEVPRVAFDRDDERDNLRWNILRWNLQPSDPTQPLSPPKKPIVFYLDHSIPLEYRPAIRDGILEWNKAFERIGISGAIQVLDAPDDPSWDPDDIRNSVVRWVANSPSDFGAVAQIVWDPRTGEIFRGGVLLDSNLGRIAKTSERLLLNALSFPASAATAKSANTFKPLDDEAAFNNGLATESAFGSVALELMGAQDADKYVYERLKAVAMHEVGHDFGLSHNFIAHNAYTEDQIKSATFTEAHGTTASVMDYWAINLWPKGTSSGTWFPTTLGTYDDHVIHWGYAPVPGATTPQAEIPALSRWASAATDPRYAFAGDEDGYFDGGHAIDPRIAPFVLTNRPLDWCSTELDLGKGLIATLDRRYPQPQAPWDDERYAFLALLTRYSVCARTLTHYIAGEHLTRGRIGDPGIHSALSPVPRSEELRAYRLLDKYVFDDAAWRFSPATLQRLTYEEYIPLVNFGYDPTPRHDVPVVEIVGTLQDGALAAMYDPLVLQRLADMPTKAAPGTTMTLTDLFAWTRGAIFADIIAGRPGGSQIHRNLQRTYASLLAKMITNPEAGTPLDAQALARLDLLTLNGDLHRSLGAKSIDVQTRAHLLAISTDVERALDARTVIPTGISP
jgi:hypothetical protein